MTPCNPWRRLFEVQQGWVGRNSVAAHFVLGRNQVSLQIFVLIIDAAASQPRDGESRGCGRPLVIGSTWSRDSDQPRCLLRTVEMKRGASHSLAHSLSTFSLPSYSILLLLLPPSLKQITALIPSCLPSFSCSLRSGRGKVGLRIVKLNSVLLHYMPGNLSLLLLSCFIQKLIKVRH